jgi:hypothetical protein
VRTLGAVALITLAAAAIAAPAQGTHVRPKGATPITASLVTFFSPCSAPNRTHGAPLAFPSCAPPVGPRDTGPGTPDANGAAANQIGRVRFDTIAGVPGPPDDSDIYTALSITDVRCLAAIAAACTSANGAGGPDYDGEFQYAPQARITDHDNHGGISDPDTATVSDIPFPVNGQCAATADTSIGGTCSIATTFNAIVPGAIKDGKRTTWEMGPVTVFDGGADKKVSTADNFPFATQGVFVP